jgi:flagellar L-ring protein precursor FlgH
MRDIAVRSRLLAPHLLLFAVLPSAFAAIPLKPVKKTPTELRTDYLDKVTQGFAAPPPSRSLGSLWSPDGVLSDTSTDYKARSLHDTVVVLVSVQTTAAQSGNVNSARNFSTNSAISGLVGALSTHGVNPLLTAQSSTALKGQGQTSSNTTFTTSLAGEVIAVLPNGNLVVEAHRQIFMNNQHEEVVVRGVARPGDITPNNVVASAALTDLEIEMKGKGIISDSVRPPNPLTRAVLWLFGF